MDPIDISSSEDDNDNNNDNDNDNDSDILELIDSYSDASPVGEASSSKSSRVLPPWDSVTNMNLMAHNGFSPKKPVALKGNTDERSPLLSKRQNIGKNIGASSSSSDWNINGETRLLDRSKLPISRVLPSSLRPSASSVHLSNIGENDNHGKQNQHATWSNTNGLGNLSNGNSFGGTGVDLLRVNRILPPSLISGKHSLVNVHGGLNDSLHHAGILEGKDGPDERLIFQEVVQNLNQHYKTEVTLPGGLLSVPLLRHQRIALSWMLSKESSGLCLGGILADDQGLGKTVSMISLIQMQRHKEAKCKPRNSWDLKSPTLNLDDYDEKNGCISLDDLNLQKETDDVNVLPSEDNSANNFKSRRPTAGTLVVCPASVMRQWARELEEKVADEASLSVLIYHGGNRTKDPASLAKYDVVLTTYAIVTNEVSKQPLVEDDDDEQKDGDLHGLSSAFSGKKRKKAPLNKKFKKGKKEMDMAYFDSNCGTLARVKWSRVVLDESQMIKNHRTQVARACCSIRAKRRWCLSGTPIQNSVDELFSYFRFLRYDPYDNYKKFVLNLKALITRDSIRGYDKLHLVLKNIMLRRTKGTLIGGEPIINLPSKKVDLVKAEFSAEERAFYFTLQASSEKQFKAYAAAGTVNQNYANILLMLLRLRQACDHPLLAKGLCTDPLGEVSSNVAKGLPRDLIVNLLKKLDSSSAICLACQDTAENPVVTMCAHVFCYQCVSEYLTGEDNTCPAPQCREQVGADVVYSASTLKKCVSNGNDSTSSLPHELDESKVLRREYVSTKIKAALEILNMHCKSKGRRSKSTDFYKDNMETSSSNGTNLDSVRCGAEKAIVFSQWTSMLDLMEISLENSSISYRRLDGTMSIAARDKAVKDFNTKPEVDVMLMSLKAGNLGLNMVAACRVILLDLWWNPTTEDQAVDRAHRIGQTRPVTVSRLTIKDTVEDRILALQEDKRNIVASAFGENQTSTHAGRLNIEDLIFLFEGTRR